MIVTCVQAHANVQELGESLVRGAGKRPDSAVSEYDEEVADEEGNWGDFDDSGEYGDDFDLPWT
jgi:hypothetical protein